MYDSRAHEIRQQGGETEMDKRKRWLEGEKREPWLGPSWKKKTQRSERYSNNQQT